MKRFAIVFLLTILAFGVANAISYYVRSDAIGAEDAIRRAGFPFLVWEEGGVAYRYHFSHGALCGDIIVAVCVGIMAAILASRIKRRAML